VFGLLENNKVKYSLFGTACAAACLALASTGAVAGAALDRIKKTGKVVIAYRDSSIPFSYVPQRDGQPVGYAIDLCTRFAKAIGKKLEIGNIRIEHLQVTTATRMAPIVDGRADLECESVTNTAERREKVAFTIPHYVTGARIVVLANSSLQEIKDFRGKKLVSTAKTNPLKVLEQTNRLYNYGITTGEVADHLQGIQAVESGAADGFLMDEALLNGLIAARPNPSKLKIIGRYVTVEPLAVMLPHDDADLKRIVDDEMRRLILSGEATALHDRWFLQPIPPDNRTLNLKMPYLLKDFWKYPNDWVPN